MKSNDLNFKLKTIFSTAIFSIFIFDIVYLLIPQSLRWLQIVVGLPILLLLPGLLTVLLLGAKRISLKEGLMAVGLSLLELIFVGLMANYISEIFGAQQPLHAAAIPLLFNFFIATQLAILFLKVRKHPSLQIAFPRVEFKAADYVALLSSLLMLLLSVFGTFHLNNGASNTLSMFCLALGMLTIIGVAIWHKRLHTLSMVVLLFSIALSVLMLVSLRSWYITGHDIKTEYMVYTLTAQHGRWDINFYKNAYNACLSITLLPVVFTKLLHTSGPMVFKFIFQVLFALCPVSIFVFVRRYASRLWAFLGATLFISFPTFTTDSPMLTRQEVAFLFFSLLLIAWFDHTETWLHRQWRLIFMLLSAGIILSHYSSTYMYIATLILMYLGALLYRKFIGRSPLKSAEFMISGTMVLVIFLGGFLWYSQVTRTSNHLTGVVKNSLSNLTNLLQQDNRDTSVNYSILGFGSNNQEQFNNFIASTKTSTAPSNQDITNSIRYVNNQVPSPPLVSDVAKTTHLNLGSVVNKLYYGIVPRLYQVFVLFGIVGLLFVRKLRQELKSLPLEYVLLCVAGAFVLGLQIVLPNISLDYGLLRAFQQNLMFFALPIILAIYVIFEKLHKNSGVGALVGFSVLCSLLFTNFLPQLTGGVPASLNLNNNGPYYGAHYTFKSDLLAAQWLDLSVPHNATVRSASASSAVAYNPAYPFTKTGSLPFQVPRNSYVLLGNYETSHGAVYINVAHNLIPVKVESGDFGPKSQIYSSGKDVVLR